MYAEGALHRDREYLAIALIFAWAGVLFVVLATSGLSPWLLATALLCFLVGSVLLALAIPGAFRPGTYWNPEGSS